MPIQIFAILALSAFAAGCDSGPQQQLISNDGTQSRLGKTDSSAPGTDATGAVDTAIRLVAALQMDARYAARVDAVIEATRSHPRLWSGRENADTAELRYKLARETLLKRKPQVLDAVAQRLASTYGESDLQDYLAHLKSGREADHPLASNVDRTLTDVIWDALMMVSVEVNEQAEGR